MLILMLMLSLFGGFDFASNSQWMTDYHMSEPWLPYTVQDWKVVQFDGGAAVLAEVNPLLAGQHDNVMPYVKMVRLGEGAISEKLDSPWREVYQVSKIAFHARVIKHNNDIRESLGYGRMYVVSHTFRF